MGHEATESGWSVTRPDMLHSMCTWYKFLLAEAAASSLLYCKLGGLILKGVSNA